MKPRYSYQRGTLTDILFALAICKLSTAIEPVEQDNLGKPREQWWWNLIELPTIHAAAELGRGRPKRAIELLQPVLPYEPRFLLPVYVRGLAYLWLGRGSDDAAEFQKIVLNKGAFWMLSSPGLQTIDPPAPLY